jgi:chromosome partitioning protein
MIVVGNEKGGSGKTTVAMHTAVALASAGFAVAALDLDFRQKSLFHYLENREAWSRESGRILAVPDRIDYEPSAGNDAERQLELQRLVEGLADKYQYLVVDSPGHDDLLSRAAHGFADTIVTPLNDSFMDLDVIGAGGLGAGQRDMVGPYGQLIQDIRRQRSGGPVDWIVLRNRLSAINTRNKRSVGAVLAELSTPLGFRLLEGFAERLVFREFYLKGLTALDSLNEAALGVRPTLSHASAQFEVRQLIEAILGHSLEATDRAGQVEAA